MKLRRIRRGGKHFRVADPAWKNPLDGRFAARRGGRWNPPDSFPVVYLNASLEVARANVLRRFAGQPFGPEDLDSEEAPVLVVAEVPRGQYVDVVTDEGCEAAGLPATYPRDGDALVGWDRCQPVGQRAWDEGAPGIACRSAAPGLAREDEELAWIDRGTGGPSGEGLRKIRIEPFEEWFWPPGSTFGDMRTPSFLEALNEAHASGPSEEEVEQRRAWKRQHRRRIEGKW